MSKGQSAIEYLTTYGWMLVVIAIVGGTVFSVVKEESNIKTISSSANSELELQDFGITRNGIQAEIQGRSRTPIRDVQLCLINTDNSKEACSIENITIPVENTRTITIPGVKKSDNSQNTFTGQINYDIRSLENLQENITIIGKIKINRSQIEPEAPENLQLAD